jgi:hypothetical protein
MLDQLTEFATIETLAFGLVMFISGMCVPFRYGVERLRGFGRAIISRLPYEPPAGLSVDEALEQTTDDPAPDGPDRA